MRADTVSLIDKLAREHRLKKKEYLALLENASVEEHVHAAMLADKERRRIYGTEVFIRGLIEVGNICRNNSFRKVQGEFRTTHSRERCDRSS